MTLFTLKNFGDNIVRCTANSALSLTIKLKLSGKTEISDFDLHSIIEEEVSKLKISVDHSVAVQVLYGRAYLIQIALNLDLMKALSPSQKLIQSLVLAEL